MDEVDFLGAEMVELSDSADKASQGVTGLNTAIGRNADEAERATQKYQVSTSKISRQIGRAFDDLIFDGAKLSDVMRGLAQSISQAAYSAAMRPVTDHIASGITGVINGLMGFADGGAFSQGRVMPFARGGVVSSPVSFPMRGGMGLMGEAGPEAIMPLARGADGKLGVRAGGGGRPVSVVMNIQTPDVEGFRRSQSQLAAQMGRALALGQRNR